MRNFAPVPNQVVTGRFSARRQMPTFSQFTGVLVPMALPREGMCFAETGRGPYPDLRREEVRMNLEVESRNIAMTPRWKTEIEGADGRPATWP